MKVNLLVKQGRPTGKSLQFGTGEFYFGRGEECHVRFDSDWISRQHCLLTVRENEVQIADLGSRNGTLVNGELLQDRRSLHNGDQIHVGPIVFEVRFEPGTEPVRQDGRAVIQTTQDRAIEVNVPLNSTATQPALQPGEEF